uniref:Kinase-like protein n=1 Tax=Tetraselmis sp. GSL018 TaxID=582737 RepID=A0A061SES5_9CHLO|mmetsp:Transcript_17699/g.42443  ORF Transcript_17699/g.42443 Transcript_17699/m.42443 type:complete len:451 (+) Transcript_17699:622-1974(+)
MGGCCSVGGEGSSDGGQEEWAQWDTHPVREHYEILEDIGEGAFSKVVRAQQLTTGEEVALKIVHRMRPGVKPHHWEILYGEKETLQALQHPNIITLKESYEDEAQLVMVLERLKGGELLEHLKAIKFYCEQKAAQLFVQIARAVNFMHEKGFLHRDLKPENILFVESPTESPDDQLTLKLIDMGMATRFNPATPVRGAMGTAGFLAPECCHKVPHSPAMDIWSLGMLLFTMLTGRMPYSHTQIERLHYPEIPITKSPGVQSQRFLSLSTEAQELLLGMLQHDPIIRMTAAEVLQHQWVITEGLAKPAPAAQSAASSSGEDRAATKGKKSIRISGDSRGEITSEDKAGRSRKNLKQIQMQASQKSLKNLLRPQADSGGAEASRSKSRFDIGERPTRSRRSLKGADVSKGKSFFDNSNVSSKVSSRKSMFRSVSNASKTHGMKTNRVAVEPS